MYNTTLVTESKLCYILTFIGLKENYTEAMIHDINLLRIKQDIDNGIIDYVGRSKGMNDVPKITTSASHYPLPIDRFVQDFSITAFLGPYWFNLPCVVTFLVIIILMIDEKEQKLRKGLNVFGVSHLVYWLHWIITSVILSTWSTLLQIISGMIFKFEFFINTNFVILFTMFLMYNLCMCI